MPDIAVFHPQVVHFVVVLGIVGVLLRIVSLTPWFEWSGPAATALLLGAAVAGVVAAESGQQAHGIVERIPGAREAVHEHEEAGELARNVLLVIGALELAGLALRKKEAVVKGIRIASVLVGLFGIYAIYEAGEHGGELVYAYAGGVGTRSGEPEDVENLLVAGLYHEARLSREAGRKDEAARLTEELARQKPDDASVQLLLVESLQKDRGDPAAAMAMLNGMASHADDRFFAFRSGLMKSELYVALGYPDSARALLTEMSRTYEGSRSIQEALDKLK